MVYHEIDDEKSDGTIVPESDWTCPQCGNTIRDYEDCFIYPEDLTMATAKQVKEQAAKGEGCLGKAADDEPVFVLRAQDVHAAMLVRKWAKKTEAAGGNPEKIKEARDVAKQMDKWPTKKVAD
jgi:hypothetical protein